MAAQHPLRRRSSRLRRSALDSLQHIARMTRRFGLAFARAQVVHGPGVEGRNRRRRPQALGENRTGGLEQRPRKTDPQMLELVGRSAVLGDMLHETCELAHHRDLFRSRAPRRIPRRQRRQLHVQLDHVLDGHGVRLAHARALVQCDLGQTLRLEPLQCSPHDRAADIMGVGDFNLAQRLTWRHAAQVDRQGQLVRESRCRRPVSDLRKRDQMGFTAAHGTPVRYWRGTYGVRSMPSIVATRRAPFCPYRGRDDPAKARLMPMPDSTRYARDAAETIGARFEDLDAGDGYLFRISRGERFVLGGGGNVCTYPVNNASSYTISRDKAHTKAVLTDAGLDVIPGGLFFAHARRAALRSPGRELEDAHRFAANMGYPVFIKPNHGSRGTFAEIITSPEALDDYASRIASEFESFLMEPVLDGDEHRVFVQDGKAIFHSAKASPSLVGDGRSTLAELLAALNAAVSREGVSALPVSVLAGRAPGEILAVGERLALPGRRNLSAAGGIESVSEDCPPELARPAIAAVQALGLRIGAVDMFDLSRSRDFSDPVIIEVNGNPGLKTLELAGRMDLIRTIWVSMLNACLDS